MYCNDPYCEGCNPDPELECSTHSTLYRGYCELCDAEEAQADALAMLDNMRKYGTIDKPKGAL